MKELSIILLNYNSSDYTIKCIESILHYSISFEYEILVVDNASEEKDFINLKNFCNGKNIKFITSNLNTGFAAGNMLGASIVDSKYTLFLNNDTMVKEHFIDKLYQFMEKNSSAALCGGQMFDENDNWINSFGNLPSLWERYLGKGGARLLFPSIFKSPKKQYDTPSKVGFVSGSDLFVRTSVFNKVGGLDKRFFLYCEEEDLGLMMNKEGHGVYYIPDAHFTHYCGASTGRSLKMDKEFYISFKLLITKHFGGWGYLLYLPSLLFKHFKKFYRPHHLKLLFFILKGSPEKESLRHQNTVISGR